MINIFQLIGIIVVSYVLIKVLIWFYRMFFIKNQYKKYIVPNKTWSVVTGCTSGVGQGFAMELASKKSNMILVSRNKTKLEDLKSVIVDEFGVAVEIVVVDFGKDYDLKELENKMKGKQISVLVNNVGINHEVPNYYLECPKKEVDQIIKVNIMSLLNMTRTVTPKMIENKKGLIINLASFTNIFKTPCLAVYAGTKSFVDIFSQSFYYENKKKGIETVCINPMYVKSNMSGFRKTSLTVISARNLASKTLNNFGGGILGNPISYIPNYIHSILIFVISLAPQSIGSPYQMNEMLSVKKRLLRRKEKMLKKQKEQKIE